MLPVKLPLTSREFKIDLICGIDCAKYFDFMQYVTRPMLKASTLLDKFIGFTFEEMDLAGDIMLKALEKELARTKKKYDKYLSIQEIGEATTRQQTILYNVEQRYNDLDNLVHDLKELIDFSKRIRDPNRLKKQDEV